MSSPIASHPPCDIEPLICPRAFLHPAENGYRMRGSPPITMNTLAAFATYLAESSGLELVTDGAGFAQTSRQETHSLCICRIAAAGLTAPRTSNALRSHRI